MLIKMNACVYSKYYVHCTEKQLESLMKTINTALYCVYMNCVEMSDSATSVQWDSDIHCSICGECIIIATHSLRRHHQQLIIQMNFSQYPLTIDSHFTIYATCG